VIQSIEKYANVFAVRLTPYAKECWSRHSMSQRQRNRPSLIPRTWNSSCIVTDIPHRTTLPSLKWPGTSWAAWEARAAPVADSRTMLVYTIESTDSYSLPSSQLSATTRSRKDNAQSEYKTLGTSKYLRITHVISCNSNNSTIYSFS
jgi:hypothetical protein